MVEAEKYVPNIEFPSLPARLPTSEAIKSCKQNETNYEPELWGLEYAVYRYLERVPEEALRARYASIVRNIRSYTNPERDRIPIRSYQSSWYWHRKEYQTRLEFAYRKLPPPKRPLASEAFRSPSAFNPRDVPNGVDVLFRYGKREHMESLALRGQLRAAPASSYEAMEHNEARRDEERRKRSFMPGKHTKITTADGKPIEILGDVTRTITGSQYHLICFSREWDEKLFDDFEADACAVIFNPKEFIRRLGRASADTFPGWYFHHDPVSYFDPYEMGRDEYFDASMSKDFSFAYQNEYRVIWSRRSARPVEGFQLAEIGNAQDIVKLFDRNGLPIT
ncbi:MAG: hypothetical protein P4L57_12575 [Rhizomicrobium sp.]|nr:hypothetical protein [Rhizomicrobium sp.]